jgi:pyruvate/2-oxoglutarate dehydrogenase complex dihydrolipoamide acyltransferase (E2) component
MPDPVVFSLPDIGEGLAEGEVLAWLVAEGDAVARDQPLVEVLTDKATVELPAPVAGTVLRLLVPAGSVVPVGTALVELAPTAASAPAAPAGSAPAGAGAGLRPKAAPATRRLATELGVGLDTLRGTGPGGRILPEDVRAAAAETAPTPAPAVRSGGPGVQPLRGIRRVTAAAMARSWAEVPHIHVGETVDATRLVELAGRLDALRADRPEAARVTPLVLFTAAVARALRTHPEVNASIDPVAGTITLHDRVHVGIAVATEAGLVVPVVADADHLPVAELAARIHRLVAAARSGALTPSDVQGGTCTVSNYGRLGGEWATPIIRPPEAAIVGFGAIRPRPHVVDGAVVARPTLPVVLGADHRLIDGDLAVAFLTTVCAALAEPLTLVLGPGA